MINLLVGKTKTKIPNSWDEITLDKYSKIYEIIKENEFEEPTHEDGFKTDQQLKVIESQRNLNNLKVNKLVFQELTGLTNEIVNNSNAEKMSNVLMTMTNFLNSNITDNEKIDGEQKSFKYKNKEYFFPKSKMTESTFGDFIETAQLDMLTEKNKAGKFGVIAEQMAILCREVGEVYNEQKVLKKSKLFKGLTMDVVWNFVFFLTKQTNIYKKNSRTYLKAESETKTDTQQKIGKL